MTFPSEGILFLSSEQLLVGVWRESDEFRSMQDELVELLGNWFWFSHSRRVARLVYRFVKQNGASEAEAIEGAAAAFLHDVGKRERRLMPFTEGKFSTDQLDDRKREFVRKWHCRRGPRELCKLDLGSAERYRGTAEEVCLYHHHPVYQLPTGLKHRELVLVVAIADQFDAMLDPGRPNHAGALSIGTATALILQRSRKQLHPGLTKKFLAALEVR